MDPGGGNREFPVISVELGPVLAADRRPPTDLAELLRICLLDLAPPAPPECTLAQRSSAVTSPLASSQGRHLWLRHLDPEGQGGIPGRRHEGEVGRIAGPVVLD